jgi:hypothetical protein
MKTVPPLKQHDAGEPMVMEPSTSLKLSQGIELFDLQPGDLTRYVFTVGPCPVMRHLGIPLIESTNYSIVTVLMGSQPFKTWVVRNDSVLSTHDVPGLHLWTAAILVRFLNLKFGHLAEEKAE